MSEKPSADEIREFRDAAAKAKVHTPYACIENDYTLVDADEHRAMVGLTRSWARKLGSYQITGNLVASGWIPVECHREFPKEAFESYRQGCAVGTAGSARGCRGDNGFSRIGCGQLYHWPESGSERW